MRYLITYKVYLNAMRHRNREPESLTTTTIISECPGKWWENRTWATKHPPNSWPEWDGCTVLCVHKLEKQKPFGV